jgi:hypothetical protein
VETESAVIALGLFLGCFVKIDNSPSLVPSIMSTVDNNLLSFIVFLLVDINNFLVLDVDEVFSMISEDLPPS